ncbi:MAG: ABC transporter ATP-binding protein [Clostridia bacterium]|nr:ABC transporter ATP-binding protein [Clostridia bacterium]
MDAVLDVEQLTISFTQYTPHSAQKRTLHCVKGLDLTVNAGEIVAVVGESGSGKSLLAHGILGILPYNARMEGSLRFRGEPLTAERAAALRGRELVLVPQGVSYLDPLMKVGPQLRRGDDSTARKTAVSGILRRYGLAPDTEEKYPFELSGGMARRVLISSAVLETPALVIADEPTPGLDDATARRVLGHFREIAEGGAAVLFITHDLALAADAADRVIVLRDGAALAEFPAGAFGSPETLAHPYVAALWRAMPEHAFMEGLL